MMFVSAPPKPAGRLYITPSFCIETAQKPGRLHRAMMRLLLGWRWVDAT